MRIGIIGAGYSGTALAANLHRLSHKNLEIFLCEKRPAFGLGDAYSTPYPYHLLNVRASDMSAFEDELTHFLAWLKQQPHYASPTVADQFVPRLLYGQYLQSLIAAMQNDTRVRLQLVNKEILEVIPQANHAILKTQDENIIVDKVVLAVGNNPVPQFPFTVSPTIKCISNPWDFTAPAQIKSYAPVLIVGTGLSMIDTVLTLVHQNHTGPIYAVSRHGLLPLPHSDTKTPYPLDHAHMPKQLRPLMKFLRSHSNEAEDWRSVINGVRHHISALWQAATVADRKRFIRHVLPYWNVHRHRVPIEISALLAQMIEQKRLTIVAGHILKIDAQHAHIKRRESTEIIQLPIEWVINCMGPQLKMRTQNALLHSMQAQGLICFDELNLGLVANNSGALKRTSGEYSEMFYTLGSLTKGTHWEITAVPDIRKQCLALAKHLLQ